MADKPQGDLLGKKIAYFSMEIGIKSDIPTYAGGLGVLAGDTLRSSADLNLPLIGITLVSRGGYFRQEIDPSGRQVEHEDPWDPASENLRLLPVEAEVEISGRPVRIRAWEYAIVSPRGGMVPVLFLDTFLDANSKEDRKITTHLYGGGDRYRLEQEVVLGIGGMRILQALGIDARKYHMNEGHSSLLALELLHRYGMDPEAVKELCVFTTHTPMEAGHDKFPYSLVEEVLGDGEDMEALRRFGGEDHLNMTRLALNLSNYVNGVAKRHMEVSSRLFPGYKIRSVTNGVHSYTWTCPCFQRIFDRYIPGWANEPEMLVRVDASPDEEIWAAHAGAKRELIDYVNSGTDVGMDYSTLTLGFARRATEYKRASFLFSDLKRLRRANKKGRIQVVMAGKAHPRDQGGKGVLEEVFDCIGELEGEIKIAYLENYSMDLAARMISGSDVWLNTPLPPFEASGTSGMKAAHNGVINFSVLDGWWLEGCIDGVTGWSIGPHPSDNVSEAEARAWEQDDLYNKLEYIIIPLFYQRRDEWIRMMNNSIGMVAYYFNSHRMMRRYVTDAYL